MGKIALLCCEERMAVSNRRNPKGFVQMKDEAQAISAVRAGQGPFGSTAGGGQGPRRRSPSAIPLSPAKRHFERTF